MGDWSRGARKAVCKRAEREREQPHESSAITSRTQAAAESESESASARPLRGPRPDSPQTGLDHPLNTASSSPLRLPLNSPPSRLLHLLLKNQNNLREGGKSLSKPADSLKDNKNNHTNKYI